MRPIKIFFDKKGNTLNVWLDNPDKEAICEETKEEIIIIKDKNKKVIGFEVLNYLPKSNLKQLKKLAVETQVLTD